jgi:hypothetical protein
VAATHPHRKFNAAPRADVLDEPDGTFHGEDRIVLQPEAQGQEEKTSVSLDPLISG